MSLKNFVFKGSKAPGLNMEVQAESAEIDKNPYVHAKNVATDPIEDQPIIALDDQAVA